MGMTARQHAEAASVAHCDLNIFGGVMALLEGGTMSADTYSEVERIIVICRSGSQKALRRFDRHIAAIKNQPHD